MAKAKSKNAPMSGAEYQKTIDHFGLSQMAAGRFLRVSPRTARRYVSEETTVPHAVALLFGLMIEKKVKPEQLGFEG